MTAHDTTADPLWPRGAATGRESAIARWQESENRLYPLIVADPELYEVAVGVVVEVREVLRARCDTVAALLTCDATAVLAACPSVAALVGQGFDPATAFGAACACRWRELSGIGPSEGRFPNNPAR